ncbi:MAG: hypothetical protein LBQ54_13195 [Planctomycetaceae bacterium]|jgi:hypothetical protein|nr:hypothetical protein [Planctomycetaceae bacterium]
MEKLYYLIIKEDGQERQTESLNEARKAFRLGLTVVECKICTMYTEFSKIVISVSTELQSM